MILTKRAIEWVFARAKKDRNLQHATGYRGAASATGEYGAAAATGEYGAAAATGYQGAAMASGSSGTVSGADGNAIFAVERDNNWKIISVAGGIVGEAGIEPNTRYRCVGGKLVQA